MLVHLRVVPGFRVAVEERHRPALRSYPVIVGGLPHERGAVCEANLRAQEHDIHPGMSLSDAHRLCPDGIFLSPHPQQYESAWAEVLEVLSRFTPVVESIEMGQAVCDLGGCERHFPDIRSAARVMAASVWKECGVVPWMGAGSNRFVAQVASLQVDADGVAVIEAGGERQFLAGLPVTALPGVDERLALLFQVLGIRTAGALAALPATSVRQRFGADGERMHLLARGIDPRPVVPPLARSAILARHVCEEGSIEDALEALATLAGTCGEELERRALSGRVVAITLIWHPEDEMRMGLLPTHKPDPIPPLPDDLNPIVPAVSIEGQPRPSLPVAYRIHSMIPQPGTHSASRPVASPIGAASSSLLPPPAAGMREVRTHASAVTRTSVCTSTALYDRARTLLLQHWPQSNNRRLRVLELEVSEFEQPTQLGFAELNLLGETGALAGLSAERVQTLMRQEEVLAARYGDASFRHLERLDPTNLLAERRFRWAPGLQTIQPAGRTPIHAPSRRRRRR